MFQFEGRPLAESDLASYTQMRACVEKPPGEERHFRHIQRYYACRGLRKVGYPEVLVLPAVTRDDGVAYHPDVVARRGEGLVFAYCAAGSLAELPREEIARLTSEAGPVVLLVVAGTLDVPALQREYHDLVEAGRVSIRTMPLPPFEQVLEYDIWMFELAFQDVGR